MGMTIDESINGIEKRILPIYDNDADHEALVMATNIMRNYQKIQEIVRWNNAPSPYYKPDGQLFREIIEVLADGNDD